MKPLLKKEINIEAKSCRLIFLFSLISKVIKKLIHDQPQDHLQISELLYTYQSGFRAIHFTDTCLTQLSDMILNGAENEKYRGAILISFSLISKTALILKSSSLISQTVNRGFLVLLGNAFSGTGTIDCERFILGPLLVLLYFKDIPQALRTSPVFLCADGTIIFY